MSAGMIGDLRSMTSPTRISSNKSTLYSRVICWPRRASFSVRIERRSSSTVTPSAATLPMNNAGRAFKSCVSSSRKPCRSAANASCRPSSPPCPPWPTGPGRPRQPYGPSNAPSAPPMISNGASTPPEVPEPSATAQTSALADEQSNQRSAPISCPMHQGCGWCRSRRPARAVRSMPPMPTTNAPMPATTSSGSAASETNPQRHKPMSSTATNPSPPATPTVNAASNSPAPSTACGGTGNIGPAPSNGTRKMDATIAATATGIKLRGFHSNNNNSTASNTRRDRRGKHRGHAGGGAGHQQGLSLGRRSNGTVAQTANQTPRRS